MKFSEKTTLQMKQAIARVLPAGNGFRVLAEPTMIGKTHVLRIVTPAWSRKPRFDRVFKLQQAILPVLSVRDKEKIFRFSVLTPDEWKEVRNDADFRPRKFTELASQNAARPKAAKASSARKPSQRITKPATS